MNSFFVSLYARNKRQKAGKTSRTMRFVWFSLIYPAHVYVLEEFFNQWRTFSSRINQKMHKFKCNHRPVNLNSKKMKNVNYSFHCEWYSDSLLYKKKFIRAKWKDICFIHFFLFYNTLDDNKLPDAKSVLQFDCKIIYYIYTAFIHIDCFVVLHSLCPMYICAIKNCSHQNRFSIRSKKVKQNGMKALVDRSISFTMCHSEKSYESFSSYRIGGNLFFQLLQWK